MVKAYSLDELRRVFRNAAGNNCKKLFEKRENGISFIFNRQSFNKIGCDKSINNSVARGFTVIDHFKVAANIKELFDNSEVVAQWNKKKKARTETNYLCRCEINKYLYAWMRVTTWGKNEGYIDFYLSKDGE